MGEIDSDSDEHHTVYSGSTVLQGYRCPEACNKGEHWNCKYTGFAGDWHDYFITPIAKHNEGNEAVRRQDLVSAAQDGFFSSALEGQLFAFVDSAKGSRQDVSFCVAKKKKPPTYSAQPAALLLVRQGRPGGRLMNPGTAPINRGFDLPEHAMPQIGQLLWPRRQRLAAEGYCGCTRGSPRLYLRVYVLYQPACGCFACLIVALYSSIPIRLYDFAFSLFASIIREKDKCTGLGLARIKQKCVGSRAPTASTAHPR